VRQSFVKAGAGPVVIQPLAVFGVSSTPALRFGYYESGSPNNKTELLTVKTADAQSVNVVPDGVTSFDPGGADFGFYSIWPGFKNTDNSVRTIYSEDVFNTFDTNESRHIRVYPYKNPDGSVVPNAYVVANEEFPAGTTSQDFVAIVYNVTDATRRGDRHGKPRRLPGPDSHGLQPFPPRGSGIPDDDVPRTSEDARAQHGTDGAQHLVDRRDRPFSVLSATGAQSGQPGQVRRRHSQFNGDSDHRRAKPARSRSTQRQRRSREGHHPRRLQSDSARKAAPKRRWRR
jgi:hypothetical protein